MASTVWDLSRGFLPSKDPIKYLPGKYKAWNDLAEEAPKLLAAGEFGKRVRDLPVLSIDDLGSEEQLECAMRQLSFLGHSEIWESWKTSPKKSISAAIAVPWHKLSQKLDRPPVLSYASYALYNWRRIDIEGPVELGNLALLQNFLGGIDEEWFILVHVEIEAKALHVLQAMDLVRASFSFKEYGYAEQSLCVLLRALIGINQTLVRMTEYCDPYIYYNRVRPYIHGWKNNPALPEGVIYEGVEEFGWRPQSFRGETGAQSTIIPALDAFLGIKHADKLVDGTPDILKSYLLEMQRYMPGEHRDFLKELERRSETFSIRNFILWGKKEYGLADAYNACIEEVAKFRERHLEYAGAYIHKQSQESSANPHAIGTGGTPFMKYLKKHLDETRAHIIK